MARSEPMPDIAMAYLDGEMSPEEVEQFERLLEQHPEWREELAEMASVVEATDALAFAPPPAEVWDNYWEEIDSQLSKRTGWLLAAAGGAILAAAGIIKILLLTESLWIRVGLALVVGGLLLLFISVLRGRLLEIPNDRYRKIRK
ncbi:hypothetical protein KQI84_11730 [bacterium]|nr:hypothetical protein [bacterium]